MEGNLNKKLILTVSKFGTWVIGISYFIQTILACFGIQLFLLNFLFSISVIPTFLLLTFSFFLGFCYWHRLPIYYALSINILNVIDFYIGLSVTSKWILIVYLLLIGLFVLIGCLIKNVKNVEERNLKKNST